ncbi:hypothetical protein O4H49_18865 [Kiloniella laminariae]|uniref:Lipoprotein n=1 Tax=Kiloniella laminariae TaxID=454162 RepID=A0ABT4LP49_9PROT|nr:hypothetical protein [Kiloniella laminariae]MCZ4282854.1 hypothetical protein [Kiloniella laminariae]
MYKKFGLFILIAAALAGCQTTSEADRKKGLELSIGECPVNLSPDVMSKLGDSGCERRMTNSRTGYYYSSHWEWDSSNKSAELYYQPIKSYQYWTTDPTASKEDIHLWGFLNTVNLDKISEVQCSGFSCYSFTSPLGAGTCFWFARDAKQGTKTYDVPGASDLLEGYTCDRVKRELYSAADAKEFLGGLVFNR